MTYLVVLHFETRVNMEVTHFFFETSRIFGSLRHVLFNESQKLNLGEKKMLQQHRMKYTMTNRRYNNENYAKNQGNDLFRDDSPFKGPRHSKTRCQTKSDTSVVARVS